MEDYTLAIITLLFALGIIFFTLWIKHRNLLKQRRRIVEKLGFVKENLSETSNKLDLLSRGVDTILSETPKVRGLLGVHQSLESAEALLFNQGIPISNSESCAIASHAAKSILNHYPGNSNENDYIIPGLHPLVERLASMLHQSDMMAEDIELSANEHRRLGELFYAINRTDWAADCFIRANDLDPEDEKTLLSLAEIQRKNGDIEALDRTIERLLAINPDNIGLLREQIILLDGKDASRINRNSVRLEALGENPAPSSTASELSEIARRAKIAERGLDDDSELTHLELIQRASKLFALGEITIAQELVQQSLEIENKNGPAWLLNAKILAAGENNTKKSLKSVRRAASLGEKTVLLESEILENDGRIDAAIEVLTEYIEYEPSDSEVRAKLCLLWLRKNSPSTSKKILDNAPEESWNFDNLHIMNGRLILSDIDQKRDKTGKLDQLLIIDALVSFDKAIELNRESGLAWLGRARALRYQGTHNDAEISLIRARRLIPDHPSIPIEEAQLFLDMNNIEQANAFAIESTTILKNNPTVLFLKGVIAARMNRLDEAISYFTRTLEIDPNHIRARLNRCSATFVKDDLENALDDANYLVERCPDHESARFRRAEILMHLGDWREAEKELRVLLTMNAGHPTALVLLGKCMIAMGRSSQAEKPLNKAIELNPNLSDAWFQRGELYLDFNRIDEAASDFEQAVKITPHHIDARLRIAAILHEADDIEKAIVAWRNILDIDPQNRLARRRISECKQTLNSKEKITHPKD